MRTLQISYVTDHFRSTASIKYIIVKKEGSFKLAHCRLKSDLNNLNIKFKLESLNSIKISEVTKVKNGRLEIHSGFMVQIIYTARKMKVSIKDFSSKCDQIRSFQRIWSHLLKKSLLENFIFCAVLREKTYFTSSTNIARFIRVIYSITILSR